MGGRDLEFSCIRLHCLKIKSITCITIYRSPDGNTQHCIDALSTISDRIKKDFKGEVVFHGDFNINCKNRKFKWSTELKGWEAARGLKQLIVKPTRVDKSSVSVIDLCFTNIQHISNSGVIDINISYHLPYLPCSKKEKGE